MNRSAEPQPQRDWSTRGGALVLAEVIRRYWRDRGFPDVEIWIEPLVAIKSRLGPGGLPPASPRTS
jgi:hypothetical protein